MPASRPRKPASREGAVGAGKAARALGQERIVLAILAAAGALLFLVNLDDSYLWQDEAQTALIARSVVEHGRPLGSDGVNSFSQEQGAEFGPDRLWRWHTWLPFYLLAAFFAVFGEGTFVARLPFALFGIATVLAVHELGTALWRTRRAGAIAALLTLTSVPFLLLSRQCRYYSLIAFFSVLGLLAYRRVAEAAGGGSLLFVAAGCLLFQTHYLYYAVLLGTVFADAVLFHRTILKRIALLSAITLLLNLPWVLWLSGIQYGARYGSNLFNPSLARQFLVLFLEQIFRHVFSPLALLLAAVLGAIAWRRRGRLSGVLPDEWRGAALLLLFTAMNLAALSLTVPASFFRYLVPLLPVAALLLALVVERAFALHRLLGLAAIAYLILRQPLPDYLYELTHRFSGPVGGIVRYLDEHGRPGQLVAITYEDLPVKFYTKMRVLGGLAGDDMSPAKDADWVILRQHSITEADDAVRHRLESIVPWDRYQRIELEAPDTPWENRESPEEHLYRTDAGENRVVLFARRSSAPRAPG